MGKKFDLAPVKVGDKAEAYLIAAIHRGTVVALNNDGTVDVEYEIPGRYIDNEEGSFIQLGGGPGEFVTMSCRARPEQLADGNLRFLVNPARYQS